MATTQQVHEVSLNRLPRPVGETVDQRPLATGTQAAPSRTRLLEITQRLQTSLDAEELITLFATEVKAFVRYSGILYSHEDAGLDLKLGKRAAHSCEYRLVLEDNRLGELQFMRRQAFTEQEINTLETLLCVLVHPLNNALRYRKAVQCAYTDPLTGACNRAAFRNSLKRELSLARRQDTDLSLILLDIDHFKNVNDQHGHLTGDRVLRTLTECAQHTIRESDMLFRYGGEEFVVLLSNTSPRGAELLAERLRKAVEELDHTNTADVPAITISLGVTTMQSGDTADKLISRADQALYKAKEAGRNRVIISD